MVTLEVTFYQKTSFEGRSKTVLEILQSYKTLILDRTQVLSGKAMKYNGNSERLFLELDVVSFQLFIQRRVFHPEKFRRASLIAVAL